MCSPSSFDIESHVLVEFLQLLFEPILSKVVCLISLDDLFMISTNLCTRLPVLQQNKSLHTKSFC